MSTKEEKSLLQKKKRKIGQVLLCGGVVAAMLAVTTLGFAADGVTDTFSKFGDILFSIVRVVGVIAALWGLLTFAMAIKGHDPSQRTQGLITFAGALIFVFAKDILATVGITF